MTRIVAVVPAFDEQGAIGSVVDEIRAFDPAIDVVVVDDGSTDETAANAGAAGAAVVRLPFNLGIGAAVQTGFRYALEHGYAFCGRVDRFMNHKVALLLVSSRSQVLHLHVRDVSRDLGCRGDCAQRGSKENREEAKSHASHGVHC